MTSDHDPASDDDTEEDQKEAAWDALEVMRARAAASRADRDEAISAMRESTSDDEIREHFGIDLREIEG